MHQSCKSSISYKRRKDATGQVSARRRLASARPPSSGSCFYVHQNRFSMFLSSPAFHPAPLHKIPSLPPFPPPHALHTFTLRIFTARSQEGLQSTMHERSRRAAREVAAAARFPPGGMPMGPWPGSGDDMFLGGMPYGGGMVPGILGGDFDPGGGLPPPSGPNPSCGRGVPYGGGGLPFGGGGLPGGPGGFPPPGAVPPVARHDLISPLLDPDGVSGGGGVGGGMGGRGRGRGRGGGRGGFSPTMPSAQRPAPMATMISSPRVPAPTMEPNPSHQPSHPSHSAAAMSRKRAAMNQALEAARLEASRRMGRASGARAGVHDRASSGHRASCRFKGVCFTIHTP